MEVKQAETRRTEGKRVEGKTIFAMSSSAVPVCRAGSYEIGRASCRERV